LKVIPPFDYFSFSYSSSYVYDYAQGLEKTLYTVLDAHSVEPLA